ncbi:TPA: hypothetical protein M2Q89_004817 [Escherichia coli]|nr:hypothetical protein [Escherichia coli]
MFTEEEKNLCHILSVLPEWPPAVLTTSCYGTLHSPINNHQYGIRLTLTVYDTNQDDNLLIFD